MPTGAICTRILIVAAESGLFPDFNKALDWINGVLKLIFGNQIPSWIWPWIGGSLLVLLLLPGAVWGSLFIFSKIGELWYGKFRPTFYNPENKRRAARRCQFADHAKSRLTLLNSREAWHDYQYTELEAEVEAEGRRTWMYRFPYVFQRDGLRRERSLSAALRRSRERLILVEGEPGAGKSVALRHIAAALADRAIKSRSTKSVIPLYINLKDLAPRRSKHIGRQLIEEFVLKVLKVNDRDVEEFVDDEFRRGMQEGTWLFLFDSFDELPDILSATEGDETIRLYAEAIHEFLHGMNRCRGIVASRYFRGPGGLAWPRFRIQPLSSQRRTKLVRRTNLEAKAEREFLTWIEGSQDDFRVLINNPMFLGLLCNQIKLKQPLPKNPHAAFESYIQAKYESQKFVRIRMRKTL